VTITQKPDEPGRAATLALDGAVLAEARIPWVNDRLEHFVDLTVVRRPGGARMKPAGSSPVLAVQ